MTDLTTTIFKNLKANGEKLEKYGFKRTADAFIYTVALPTIDFNMAVNIDIDGNIKTEVRDPNFDEPYTLHLVPDAIGGFVGQVKTEYEAILTDIAAKCFDAAVFKEDYTAKVIEYIKQKFGDDPEFLWANFQGTAICRRKDNNKWYILITSVSARKLGIPSDEILEIIDLRCDPEISKTIVDNENYFTGYHMNKKHWITIILDGRVPSESIFKRIDDSYLLAAKK